MSVKEYTLKFTQLSHYASEMLSDMRSRMKIFACGHSNDLVLECKGSILNSDNDISWLVVYMQWVEYEKMKQAEAEQED